MGLRLHNTLTRTTEEFVPRNPPEVTVYSCGPTVYDHVHIGNWSAFLFYDVVVRWLKRSGYRVRYVSNVTDVDDKTIRDAKKAGVSLKEFTGRYDQTRSDYARTPVKPVLDGEPIYEDHPVSFDARRLGHSIASDVRRPLYWNLFEGAFGHTYGHHSVWQMWAPGGPPVNNPLMPWYEAIERPGAAQMQHGRALMESRPFLTRVPDPSIIVTSSVPTSARNPSSFSLRSGKGGLRKMFTGFVPEGIHRSAQR